MFIYNFSEERVFNLTKNLGLCYYKTYTFIGERSQVVKALGCGSSIRGFESRRSPFIVTQFLKTHLNI